MEKITRIGIDTSKTFFQLHGVDASEKVVLKRKMKRAQVLGYFKELEPVLIGSRIASCATARLQRAGSASVRDDLGVEGKVCA